MAVQRAALTTVPRSILQDLSSSLEVMRIGSPTNKMNNLHPITAAQESRRPVWAADDDTIVLYGDPVTLQFKRGDKLLDGSTGR